MVLISGFKSYILAFFHSNKEIDIIDYYDKLSTRDKRKLHSDFFNTLLFLEIPFDRLIYCITEYNKKSNHHIINFCTKLCEINPLKASDLLDFAYTKKYNKRYFYILSSLLFGFYEKDSDNVFYKTTNLLAKDTCLAYFILGRLNFNKEEHIIDCYKLTESVNLKDKEGLLQIPYLYKSLIENEHTPEYIKILCFEKFKELFLIDNEILKNEILRMASWIKGYEEIRYNLLIGTFFSNSQYYYQQISHYFSEFENPQYFFELLGNLCLMSIKNNKRFNVDILAEAFKRFWRKNKEETNRQLMRLLTYDNPNLRLPAVDLIRHLNRNDILTISIITINNETFQLRALEVLLFSSYYNIETLLDLILSFRKSSYPKVRDYLQNKLSELILYSYNDFIYSEIKARISDELFLKPLLEALDNYHKMRDCKNKINDLNPLENEKEYMNLYYRLEREEMQKKMAHAHKGTFLEAIKESKIIRGNSWKIGDNGVSALGKYESSMSIDKAMYKNPDLSDISKNDFISEF